MAKAEGKNRAVLSGGELDSAIRFAGVLHSLAHLLNFWALSTPVHEVHGILAIQIVILQLAGRVGK
jgi:hypothetical protein